MFNWALVVAIASVELMKMRFLGLEKKERKKGLGLKAKTRSIPRSIKRWIQKGFSQLCASEKKNRKTKKKKKNLSKDKNAQPCSVNQDQVPLCDLPERKIDQPQRKAKLKLDNLMNKNSAHVKHDDCYAMRPTKSMSDKKKEKETPEENTRHGRQKHGCKNKEDKKAKKDKNEVMSSKD